MKKVLINIVLFFILLPVFANGQKIPIGIPGEYQYIKILPNYDTLVFRRAQTDLWFGLNAGGNFNLFFNDLNVPLYMYGYVTGEQISEEYKQELVEFPSSLGSGWFLGISGEYMQPEKDWAVGLKIHLLDIRSTTAETDPLNDSVRTQYVAANMFNYISFSPYFRYNFPTWRFPGLHLYGGADVEVKTNIETKIRKNFEYTSPIDHDKVFQMDGENVRLGFHFGIGMDMFGGDFWNKFRGRLTPFVDIHVGTNVLDDFGSDRNTIYARAGFSLRFSMDKTVIDTLEFDSTFLPPPMASLSMQEERGLSFIYEPENFQGQELAYVPEPQVEEIAAAEEGVIGKVTSSTEPAAQPEPEVQYTVEPNEMQTFTYPTSSNVQLNNEMKRYLDAVADYMKTNPSFVVQLIGHSDNLGTEEQQQQRSDQRANLAMEYLMNKGIEQRRIFPRGDAARNPVGSFMTEAGRRQNRRIEIIVRGSPSPGQ